MWLLTGVGLIAGLIVFCVTAPTLQYIQYQYESSASQRNRIDAEIAEIERNLIDGRRDFAEIILSPEGQGPPPNDFVEIQDEPWCLELRNAVADLQKDPDFRGSEEIRQLSEQLTQIPGMYREVVSWSVSIAAAESETSKAQRRTQEALHQIRAYFDEMEGKRRLDLALKLRKHSRKSSGNLTVAHDDLVESFLDAAQFEAIGNELMQLAILCEKLAAENDVDQLVDLKDNDLKAAFSRLEHTLQRFSGDEEAVSQLAMSLRVALFGEGSVFDDAHQTIHPGDGGLYFWQREKLLGKREQGPTLQRVEEAFNAFRPVLTDLEARFAKVAEQQRRHADLVGLVAWSIMIVTGVICVCAFVFLARRIAGIITQQIKDVERKSAELEIKNSEVRLLHDVAEAANKTASLAETTEYVMRRFAEHSGFLLAMATFTNEQGARRLVATEAWKDAGLPIEPLVASCGVDPAAKLSVRPLVFDRDDRRSQYGDGLRSGIAMMIRQDAFFVHCHFLSSDIEQPSPRILRLAEHAATRLSQTLERAQANSRLQELNSKLIDSARHAGMAEVATGVLHNVGNALNSVNTCLSFLRDSTAQSSIVDLRRTLDFVTQRSGSLEEFMTSHPKRTLIFPMLSELDTRLRTENETQLAGVEDLRRHVDHIKKIVAVQQSLARVQCVLEPTDLTQVLTKAIEWQSDALRHHQVEITSDFSELPWLQLDKHRILEIFGNLLKNAIESIVEARGPQRRVHVCVRQLRNDRVTIEVKDSGIGVKPENLKSIFSYGFTTKSNGHGFGLHSASLSAKQMGGRLEIESDGIGHGALFRIVLPFVPVAEESLV
ncbi:HAMP domain-containing histidine kinase [Blastopirellula sp. J2-11]|uniref:sensor histidine kinase n=1 Tax=Blastopirellula sp. J2-11 TaxID=2943192 RepID=UPI0021C9C0FA|nr:HAMP domain-containing sensor histidine kinase [Blastopirellula sp. J2-11]UUO08203.1 HAMP domain-containing histidine kinase [Blastopirellula sp. J2-11]